MLYCSLSLVYTITLRSTRVQIVLTWVVVILKPYTFKDWSSFKKSVLWRRLAVTTKETNIQKKFRTVELKTELHYARLVTQTLQCSLSCSFNTLSYFINISKFDRNRFPIFWDMRTFTTANTPEPVFLLRT